MHVLVEVDKDRSVNFPIAESSKAGCKYAILGRGAGMHFKSQESVVNYYKRKFPKAESIKFKS